MDFAVLGPLRVAGLDGPVALPAAKQRALLAMLLISHRETAVSSGRLIDALWGEHPPATAMKALQVYISQLRRALGGDTIVTRAPGYAIAIEPHQLDLARFELLVSRSGGEPPEQAANSLREALELFRGPPLADAPLEGAAATEADRLDGLRLAALEQRLDLDLDLAAPGRHGTLITELEVLTAEHPYRERFHAQLMLALYRSGRQADALDAYRRARRTLIDDLGLEPSRELQQLEAAILAQDPSLDRSQPPPTTRPPVLPPTLPVPPAPLLGRDDDLETAIALLDDVRILTITGPGGIGKTRFAIELAHRLQDRFADGAHFVPLAAVDDPARVASELEPYLDQDLLLVVDNFEQVLDAAPELNRFGTVIVTSRAPLRLAAEHELALGPLETEPAVALFQRRARAVDPRATHSGTDVERICERLDGLPLAIELAAARTKVLTPAEILDRLGKRLDLLSSGPRDAPQRQQTLRAAIGWSYDLLDAETKTVFSQLGVFSGGFTLAAAEAVCGPQALDGLAALTDHSLLARAQGRFTMLETVREYALEQLTGEGAVRDRHARAFAQEFAGAELGMESPAMPDWLRRLDADRENLHAALRHANATHDAVTAQRLVAALWRYWCIRGALAEARTLAGDAVALGGEPELRVPAINAVGVLAAENGDFASAREHFTAALELAREIGAVDRIVRVSSNLGSLAMYEGDHDAAIARFEEAANAVRDSGSQRHRSLMLHNLAIAHDVAGHPETAIAIFEESLAIAGTAEPAHVSGVEMLLSRLLFAGDPERARALALSSLGRAHALDDMNGLPPCLETAGQMIGGTTGARLWGTAAALRARAGMIRQPDEARWAAQVESDLRAELGDDAFARAAAEGADLSADEAVALALGASRGSEPV